MCVHTLLTFLTLVSSSCSRKSASPRPAATLARQQHLQTRQQHLLTCQQHLLACQRHMHVLTPSQHTLSTRAARTLETKCAAPTCGHRRGNTEGLSCANMFTTRHLYNASCLQRVMFTTRMSEVASSVRFTRRTFMVLVALVRKLVIFSLFIPHLHTENTGQCVTHGSLLHACAGLFCMHAQVSFGCMGRSEVSSTMSKKSL